jgi:hypothetical protein
MPATNGAYVRTIGTKRRDDDGTSAIPLEVLMRALDVRLF